MKTGIVDFNVIKSYNWGAEFCLRASELGVVVDSREAADYVQRLMECERDVHRATEAKKRAEEKYAQAYRDLYDAQHNIEYLKRKQEK